MPPRRRTGASPRLQKERRARLLGKTNSIQAFGDVAKKSKLINIIVEGDSWFAYPPEWLLGGPNSNVIDHIFGFLSKKKVVNTLCRPSNGDTAVNMTSGSQFKALTKLLKSKGNLVDLYLFSAGGNDVVGKEDLLPLLNPYKNGFTADQCVKKGKLKEKLDKVIKAYEKLLKLRDRHAPDMEIIAHTYDIVKPEDRGAEFLWGVEVIKPWIHPSLTDPTINIPPALHTDIVRILLGGFGKRLLALETRSKKFHVVDTQGTLRIGNHTDWLNEIHPTPSGFKKVAKKIYARMKAVKLKATKPKLPAFK